MLPPLMLNGLKHDCPTALPKLLAVPPPPRHSLAGPAVHDWPMPAPGSLNE
jgi:hypothetical protein